MGSVATLKCNSGYGLVGNSTTTCQTNGEWSNSIGSCHAHCENQNFSFTIKICTGKKDADCFYDDYPYRSNHNYILKNKIGKCTVSGTIAVLEHGTSVLSACSCKFELFLNGNTSLANRTVRKDVNYRLTCTDGVLSISKP